jgi:hypothetical protein
MPSFFALQNVGLWLGVVITIGLFAALLVPYLFEEIWRGKVDLGPRLPTGAGDVHPGYRGNPTPGVPLPQAPPPDATLSLRSFHVVLIWLSIVLASGTGMWGLLNHQVLLGVLSLGVAILLVAYVGYFASKEKAVE